MRALLVAALLLTILVTVPRPVHAACSPMLDLARACATVSTSPAPSACVTVHFGGGDHGKCTPLVP